MSHFIQFYNTNKRYFPSGSSSGVVCAVYEGNIALPDQLNIMKGSLEKEGLPVNTSATYKVPFIEEHSDRGSVLVNGKDSNNVKVYIESKQPKASDSNIVPAEGFAHYTVGWICAISTEYVTAQAFPTIHFPSPDNDRERNNPMN